MKFALPNRVPVPNNENLISEYQQYSDLYVHLNRSQTGQITIGPLASSGKIYRTADYPGDASVFNKGQEGMMNLLYKYVLRNYVVDDDMVTEINNALSQLNSVSKVFTVLISNIGGVYVVTSGLPNPLPDEIYDIQFIAPTKAVASQAMRLRAVDAPIIIRTLNGEALPADIWTQGSLVRLTVNLNASITLSGGGGGGGGRWWGTTAPSNINMEWIDTGNGNISKIYNPSTGTWATRVAVWS